MSRVTLKFDGGPWKIIRHFFYTTSSFVHHFNTMGEFELGLQSGNSQFGSKSAFFVVCDLEIWWMTLKTTGPLLYVASSFVHLFVAISEFKWSYSPETPNLGQNWCLLSQNNLEIWQMVLKNNREPPLSNIKLCASFHHHMWIQTGWTDGQTEPFIELFGCS